MFYPWDGPPSLDVHPGLMNAAFMQNLENQIAPLLLQLCQLLCAGLLTAGRRPPFQALLMLRTAGCAATAAPPEPPRGEPPQLPQLGQLPLRRQLDRIKDST